MVSVCVCVCRMDVFPLLHLLREKTEKYFVAIAHRPKIFFGLCVSAKNNNDDGAKQ